MTTTQAQTIPLEQLADAVALLWRDHANERARIYLLQWILRERMLVEATLEMTTLRGTIATMYAKSHMPPSKRRKAREYGHNMMKVYWRSE